VVLHALRLQLPLAVAHLKATVGAAGNNGEGAQGGQQTGTARARQTARQTKGDAVGLNSALLLMFSSPGFLSS